MTTSCNSIGSNAKRSRISSLCFSAGALLVSSWLVACGAASGGGEKPVLSRAAATLPDPNAFTLRWFPVTTAHSYRLYIESEEGKLLHQEDVVPQGCTHKAREGYQSGVCSFSYALPQSASAQASEKPVVLRLTAIDQKGRESKAAKEVYSTSK